MNDNNEDARRQEDETPISHLGLDARHPTLPVDIAHRLTVGEQAGFFYTLIDATADAIIAHRPDGSVVYANAEAARLLGYESAFELLSIPPYGWVAPSEILTAPRRIERILSEGSMTFESRARRRDGSVIPTEIRTQRVDTPLGSMLVAVIRDVSKRTQALAALHHMAYHDSLTGLSNRVHLEDHLAMAIADACRYGDDLAMAYLDLDRFKPVNDHYGHAAGDEVLIEVARRLREDLREQDTVARLGGDEFVILFPRMASLEQIELVSERLVRRIMEPITVAGQAVTVGASIGIAVFDPAADDARSLLVKADIAMYSAKLDSERPWLLYQPGMVLPDDDEARPHEPLTLGEEEPLTG